MADQVDSLNHRSTKAEVENKIEVNMIHSITISEVIRIDIGQILETGDSIDKIEVPSHMNKIIEAEIVEVI